MKIILVALLPVLLMRNAAFAQSPYPAYYFPLINKAELAIVDSNYPAALTQYKKAFAAVPFGFARDYFNAMACAAAIADDKSVAMYADTLLSLGADPKHIADQPDIAKLLARPRGRLLKARLEKRAAPIKHRVIIKALFDSLSAIDQEFRKMEGSYRVYGDTIRRIDSMNIRFIRLLIDSIGFPDQRMTGIEQPRGTGLPLNVVFVHHCQSLSLPNGKNKYNFKNDFIKAVDQGRMDPYDFGKLVSMQNDQAYLLGTINAEVYSYQGLSSPHLVASYNGPEMAGIDSNRVKHGLPPLADQHRKMAFAVRNPRAALFAFSIYASTNHYPLDSKEEYDNMLKYLKPL